MQSYATLQRKCDKQMFFVAFSVLRSVKLRWSLHVGQAHVPALKDPLAQPLVYTRLHFVNLECAALPSSLTLFSK